MNIEALIAEANASSGSAKEMFAGDLALGEGARPESRILRATPTYYA